MKNAQYFKSRITKASGKIDYNMTNDYMFKKVLQSDKEVLRSLLSSMLHLPVSEIVDVHIENPIEVGKAIEDKTFVLDVKVTLNNNMIINLEMQVVNKGNWTNRSLGYLCRNFDNLQSGQDYNSVMPVIHIGFLDFGIFQGDKEFYSTHMMMNVKTHRIYNSNFILGVLYLNRIENATTEDRDWEIDKWARLFKAGTWEEIRMIAQNSKSMSAAADIIFVTNADNNERDLLRARQEVINHELYMKNLIAQKDETIDQQNQALAQKDEVLAEKDEAIAQKDEALAQKDESLARKDEELATHKAEIARLKKLLEQK